MPLLFPSEPEFADERRAERAVWEALRDQLPPEAALFHSVPLIEGDREYEIDLLVAWPGVGLAAIEVKGGHVSREDGQWWQASQGNKRRIGSPVLQSQDSRHVLVRYLQRYSTSSAGRCRTAHLVAFPFTTVPEINEVNAGLVISRAWATDSAVWVEACMPIEVLRPLDVGCMVSEVGRTADTLGSMLAAVHGGWVANPEVAEHEWED